jgi:hypothetical protein
MGYPLRGGLPHSEISGSPGARPSPELFAACHVLHRLSVPRHPPDALLVLAHAQPQGRAKRGQRSEIREQRSDQTGLSALSPSVPGALRRIAPTRVAPWRTAYPCPGTTNRPPKARRPGRSILSCPLHGHDSLHDVKTSARHDAAPLGGRARRSPVRAAARDAVPCLATHAWWAWADLNGRPHAYQACALAS